MGRRRAGLTDQIYRWALSLMTVAAMAAQPTAPLFRAGTKLVEVTVTVLDKKGHAVAGLAGSDFTNLDERKPRPVAFFRFYGVAAATPRSAPPGKLPPRIFTKPPAVTRGNPPAQ